MDIPKLIIGWEEWCRLPALHLPIIKAKVDTGAKTSCLHAFNIRRIKIGGVSWVEFDIHPLQNNNSLVRKCRSPIIDHRYVTDSGGKKEKRYVIQTPIILGDRRLEIELTLANRDSLNFRMLLGRTAMQMMHVIVDPRKSCLQGIFSKKEISRLYLPN